MLYTLHPQNARSLKLPMFDFPSHSGPCGPFHAYELMYRSERLARRSPSYALCFSLAFPPAGWRNANGWEGRDARPCDRRPISLRSCRLDGGECTFAMLKPTGYGPSDPGVSSDPLAWDPLFAIGKPVLREPLDNSVRVLAEALSSCRFWMVRSADRSRPQLHSRQSGNRRSRRGVV